MKSLGPHDPRSLGRNRMIAVIGQGGMGRVLLGRAPSGRLVAIKQIHRQLAGNPEFRARFAREVQVSRQVWGAYTAAVVDSDTESENPWLATEYIAGPSLKAVIEECGPIGSGGLRLLATGLASALLEIHRAGLIHRDLKPANVLLASDGPRVIDFGIARALEGDQQLTATGSVIGSPAFMSPEQAEGHGLTPAADVFSVGAILAMAARGSSPFAGTSTPQILYNVMHSPPDTTGVPPGLRELVESCLAKDPAQRPTAAQLLDAAGEIVAEPVWPTAVRDRIAAHQADTDWWVATAAKDARYQEQLAGLRHRRQRRVRLAAAAAAGLLVVSGTAAAAHEWGQQSGHATTMTDPSLALSGEELRLIDACAVLEKSVVGALGKQSGEPTRGSWPGNCSTAVVDSAGQKISYELTVGLSVSEALDNMTPTGGSAGWMPMLGEKQDAAICARTVITQGAAPVTIQIQAQLPTGNGCTYAEKGLTAVVERLTVEVPLLPTPAESVLRLDPCEVLDPQLALAVVGDPGKRTLSGPHFCYADGSDFYLNVALREQTRPDSKGKAASTQIAGSDVYIMDDEVSHGSCELTSMLRPTREKLAEVVWIRIGNWSKGPGACDRGKQVMASVLPKLPK